MEVEQWRAGERAMTFDEISMERSKSFVKALQELKNLKPQLYSAAEYCEKSYLHNEQKQVVLDNLKDYAVRALVNTVDHLGTVAYKLTDLVDSQKSDLSTVELKISSLSQQVVTCQSYIDNESLWQQKMAPITRRHHKHYIMPNAINKKVRINPQPKIYSDLGPNQSLQKYTNSKVIPASKTLSWHLASESKSASDEAPEPQSRHDYHGSKSSTASEVVGLRDAVAAPQTMPLAVHLQSSTGEKSQIHPVLSGSVSKADPVPVVFSETTSPFKSLGTPSHQLSRTTIRSKNMFSSFFIKNKPSKQKKLQVS